MSSLFRTLNQRESLRLRDRVIGVNYLMSQDDSSPSDAAAIVTAVCSMPIIAVSEAGQRLLRRSTNKPQ